MKSLVTGYFNQTPPDLKSKDRSEARELRLKCRKDTFLRPTFNVAPGFLQANLFIVPKEFAFDFLLFCLRNPKPCPLVDVCDPGSPHPSLTAPEADLRSDVAKYWIMENGTVTKAVTNIESYWRDDLVSFLLGCSYSWDAELCRCGLTPRHMEQGVGVPLYLTNIQLEKSGQFSGNMLVSMRPYKPENIERVVEITSRYAAAHGAPVHIGNQAEIAARRTADAITPDLSDDNENVTIKEGEEPLFWACGTTPTAALANAKIPLAITNDPDHLFITDVFTEELTLQ